MSEYFQCPFVEGDGLHPQANIDKMASGISLTDDDRWDWLVKVSDEGTKAAERGNGYAVVSCSALKKVYRDRIQESNPETKFVYLFLYGTKELLVKRMEQRQGHYMKSSMLDSQFEDLELPKHESNALLIDVNNTTDDITKEGIAFVQSSNSETASL